MKDSLDELFEKVMKVKIFVNRDILRPDYIPNDLPHRETQILRLAETLVPVLKKSRPSNVFIYGMTGTGKTAVTKYVLNRIDIEGRKKGISLNIAYINCRHDDTNYRVLANLCETINAKVPFTGLSISELFRRFVKALDTKDRIMFVVLDEVDALVKKSGDRVLYDLTRINNQLTNAKVAIIGITNDLNFTEYLDPRVRSSLGEEELVFPPYNAVELEDILKQRADKAFVEGAISPEVIKLCAAIAAKEHGDARRALDLLRVAGEIAEREGADRVVEEHVRKAQKELEKDRVVEVIRSMPFHSKLLILSIYLIEKEKGRGHTTGEIYEVYSNIVKNFGLEPLTQRRISDLINELDMLGIVNTKIVSRGRYGRSKIASLIVPYTHIKESLKEDPRMNSFL
ncbi:MAG: cell division control protein Cdc6 [Candidatus Methanomethylicota archaeon]|jgi:cell division control protein 6|uniref:ORC1-type DNA replication protein n=1 Tax=Thermoproteota archaeon TaxID=2056631 RepID=A0A520KG38_9CREN|nr:ORC1-type DNA replication protein [Candidatus Verstraetearchaeota archaeon]RZN56782.1 MAG: ORC1-type DNA replication protein [Candidatus Verstraetearchaeota archaeon]TDA38467.1 MAG: cell division control protein Cdc6 [Candidatus Verstraetearchaeota archaeon]